MSASQVSTPTPTAGLMTAASALAATAAAFALRTTSPVRRSEAAPSAPKPPASKEREVTGPTRRWYFSRD